MEWKNEYEKRQKCAASHKKARTNTFSNVINVLSRHSKMTSSNFVAPFGNEEKKVRDAYQLKVERFRWEAIEHSRRNIFR